MDQWDDESRRCTQYAALLNAPPDFVKLLTPMRLTL
jgi:hypothetical protein